MTSGAIRGACACGRVRYEATLPSKWVGHCHCETCRRAHGAGLVTYAGFESDQVHFTEGESELTEYHSDTGAVRRFCKSCGSTISYAGPRWASEVHLAVANLLDPLDRAPTGHAYADRAPDWCPILDDLKRYGGESGVEPL